MPLKKTPRIHGKGHTKNHRPADPERAGYLIVGELTIDRLQYQAMVGRQPLHLTPREFELLWTLASHPGRVFHREELLNGVWGKGIYVAPRTVDVHMAKLRRKLCSAKTQSDLVETIWGVGYRLKIG
ncbi:MAG TPA: response regulator transcription factor [Nitrospira sp.]|jgi:DNA-binding response OmpR family regulator|nr:response regulator transcription factor [Nitrospira sp.]